mgnify:CR=1 FL=1
MANELWQMLANSNFARGLSSAMQNKQVFESCIDSELVNQDWGSIINLIDSHPDNLIKREPKKNRIELRYLHRRGSVKTIVKTIIALLESISKSGQRITNIAFMGFGKHESYPLHRDTMDVLLLQAKGRIQLEVKEINKVMEPGDIVYIPRGTVHKITPLQSRVTYSFGIEGEPIESAQSGFGVES